MMNKVLIIIRFLHQMQNHREKILILELMINLRQHHLHQMKIQREINLIAMDEVLLNIYTETVCKRDDNYRLRYEN